MLNLRHVRKTRAFRCPFLSSSIGGTTTAISNDADATIFVFYSTAFVSSSISTIHNQLFPLAAKIEFRATDIVSSFREWFKSRNKPMLHQIYEVLKTQNDVCADAYLSQLNLRLSESLVLEVLHYGKDVLSCLKFFDWAGRQHGFYHTRATYNAIFKILSRAELMSLMLDFLECYKKRKYAHRVRFYNTLVMGYAVAGKPEIALQMFGKMRFQGIDLDGFVYHVLLNALVDVDFFNAFDMIAKEIELHGMVNEITYSTKIKRFCKLRDFPKAEEYLYGLVTNEVALNGRTVGVLIDALCKNNQFEKAHSLVEYFDGVNVLSMEQLYGVWIRNLVRAGKIDDALKIVQDKKMVDRYIPDIYRYNTLICGLLNQNRLEEALDLLMEMMENGLSPDEMAMNAVLCFFCKAGLVDIALELYDSARDSGLSPSNAIHNYLINTLCADGSVEEAYCVFTNSVRLGHFSGGRTISILADALCSAGKLDKMEELVLMALEKKFRLSDWVYDKFITAFCRADRVEDGYLLHGQLTTMNKVASWSSYVNLITAFNKSRRGDIAARLLIEMQEKGYEPCRKVFRTVIRSLCHMKNPGDQLMRLLELQLSRNQPNTEICNWFIDGAGHANKPELSREVYETMIRNDIPLNCASDILMLQSYLKSGKFADALKFFRKLFEMKKVSKKLYNTMIVGLCEANQLDYALNILNEMKENGFQPSLKCYEMLVKLLCENRRYNMVINIVEELVKAGRHVSSFIGNVLLFQSLKTPELFEEWYHSNMENISPQSLELGKLIGIFSGFTGTHQSTDYVVKKIEQCFPLDIFTYNLVLRRLCMIDMDHACDFFYSFCQKGYEPNKWTYEILVHGFFRHGRKAEAGRWLGEMLRQGFKPLKSSKLIV